KVFVIVESWYRFTTQTGMLAAMRGRGAPKVGPLRLLSPVVPVPVQVVTLVPSHPLRQYLRVVPPMIGKLCDTPLTPLSRSLPLPSAGLFGSNNGTVRVSSVGRLDGVRVHSGDGDEIRAVEQKAAVPTFRHWRTSRALQATVLPFRSPPQSSAIFAPHTERHSAFEAAGFACARSAPVRTPTVRAAATRNCLTFILLQSRRP